jgi:hypothetical protein
MMTDEQLTDLLRHTTPPTADVAPSRDLWAAVVARTQEPVGWTWIDLSMAAALLTALALQPQWLWLLAYQL